MSSLMIVSNTLRGGRLERQPISGGGSPTIGIEQILGSATGVDMKSVANTALYAATGSTIITRLIVLVTDADTVSGNPTIKAGFNGGVDNILLPMTARGLTAVDQVRLITIEGTAVKLNNLDTLSFGVSTGATATTLEATVYAIGIALS